MMSDRSGEKKSMWAGWSRLSLRSRGVAVLTIPLTALAVAQFAIYRAEGDVTAVNERVVRFHETRDELARLVSALKGAETAIGGSMATGDRQHAATFDQARESVNQSLNNLASLLGDSPINGSLPEIRHQAELELQILGSLRQYPGDSPVRLGRARAAMNAALAGVAALSEEQERRFSEDLR